MLNVANNVKLMMAAHRDCLWTRWEGATHPKAIDPTKYQLLCNEGFYGEAFGIMRGLALAGYGYLGSDNLSAVDEQTSTIPEHNLKWWFQQLCKEYLTEEGFFDQSCTQQKAIDLLEKYRQLTRRKR